MIKDLMEVHEVSRLTGVSIRTLQYYDSIDLLKPCRYTEAGYRLYDANNLERLQQILLFKELQFSLKEIKNIIDSPDFDREKALEQQIDLLTLKKEQLEKLIEFATSLKNSKELNKHKNNQFPSFAAFDKSKIDEYAKQAKAQWGNTQAYKEFQEKTKDATQAETISTANEFMKIFAEFGKIKGLNPAQKNAQELVKKLQSFITEHYYNCTKEILRGLGQMYACDGEFKENIDKAGGKGTAEFTSKAIEIYCK